MNFISKISHLSVVMFLYTIVTQKYNLNGRNLPCVIIDGSWGLNYNKKRTVIVIINTDTIKWNIWPIIISHFYHTFKLIDLGVRNWMLRLREPYSQTTLACGAKFIAWRLGCAKNEMPMFKRTFAPTPHGICCIHRVPRLKWPYVKFTKCIVQICKYKLHT